MPRVTFFMPFLCHNFSQIFEVSDFFQNLTRKILQKLIFYLIGLDDPENFTFMLDGAVIIVFGGFGCLKVNKY